MPPGLIYTQMGSFARRLAEQEAGMMREMTRRWSAIESHLLSRIERLIAEIATLGILTDGEIFRLYRYTEMIQSARDEIAQYERWGATYISSVQTHASELGFEAAVRSVYGTQYLVPNINRAAVINMIGSCADGAPLFALIKNRALAGVAVDKLTQALVNGVALGYNPRKTARLMANGLSAGLTKAMVIARTEQTRAYREATRSGYKQQGITQYQRMCALSDRTCAACLALDGKIYNTDQIMHNHPLCRCFMIPVVGKVEQAYAQEWFATIGGVRQKEILGPAHYALYEQGIPLERMVNLTDNLTWGPTVGIKSIHDLEVELGIT